MLSQLVSFQTAPYERVGVVLRDGTIVEMLNVSPQPEESFLVDPAEMLRYEDEMVATWHTHPKTDSNLSGDDYLTFTMWPDQLHLIIGTDGVKGYVVKKGSVVNDARKDHPAWRLEGALAAGL